MIVMGLIVVNFLTNQAGQGQDNSQPYSVFVEAVQSGQVSEVTIEGNDITYVTGNGSFETYKPDDGALIPLLRDNNVKIIAKPVVRSISFFDILLQLLPVLIILGGIIFISRMMQGGGRNGLGFGKSKAKMLTQNNNRVTFDDVAGVEEAKQDVEELVEYLRDPGKFNRLGGKIPRGVLLVGPPGTGKTLLARAIAGEAEVPFFSIAGSDFVEMFVGVGASRVRDMFEQAKKHAPAIIFIDEIDAVGRQRSQGISGGHEEREQTLNQLLVEMDGFETNEGIIIVAATNRVDILDKALLRPGRFDRQVTVGLPDVLGREKILDVHAKQVPLAPDVNMAHLARGTTGMSGADLANLINEAALRAARNNKRMVTQDDLEWAKEKVLFGAERRSLKQKEEEIKMTAYHEGGHAIVSLFVPVKDPLHKLTIIPRSRSLGYALFLPEDDTRTMNYEQLRANMAMAFGGRLAEELIYGKEHVSTGAAMDIRMASDMARRMVEEWGYSDKVGRVFVGKTEEQSMLGGQSRDISPATAALIDDEVRRLIDEAEQTAREVLTQNLEALHRLAKTLIEYENLTGEEVRTIVRGEDFVREDFGSARPSGHRSALPSAGNRRPPQAPPSVPPSVPPGQDQA